MRELESMGRRSSLFSACRPGGPAGIPGSQFSGELANEIATTFEAILDRGMGGASLACVVEKQSSLGGTQVTLIYDVTNPAWITTERQLRAELDSAGVPEQLIEGSYVEFDFFPSGSFRIPTLLGLGYPPELQMEMSFLVSDVLVNISDPATVCGRQDETVPAGPGAVGEVSEAIGRDMEEALGIPLLRSCVTWSELGAVTSLDIQFASPAPPDGNPVPALRQLLASYGATDISSGGSRVAGGAGFSDADVGGHNVSGVINLNGNDAFNPPDGPPVQAFMVITATLQITTTE